MRFFLGGEVCIFDKEIKISVLIVENFQYLSKKTPKKLKSVKILKTFTHVMRGRFVLYQHTELDFYSASSLKQQSTDRHVAPLGHIILILSQPVFVLTS
jgi:hypothetical protein